jgi:AraC-like DNA-binding protein
MPSVLVVSQDPRLGRQLIHQCGGAEHVDYVSRLNDAKNPHCDAVIVVADRASWDSVCETFWQARGRFPSAALVALLRRDAISGALIEAARHAEVDYIAIEGIDDVAERLSFTCRLSQARAKVAEALEPLIDGAPSHFQRLFRLAIARSAEPTRVSDAAVILGVHRKTLFVWCAAARIGIGPRHALLWPRILLAARMLDQRAPCIQSVALTLGFQSGSALSATMRRLVGSTPSEVPAGGVFVAVCDALYGATLRIPRCGRTVSTGTIRTR